ncbi:hypothetical protein A3F45_00650 [Candidatus Curtissbacteria bacterium RIFCSPHIGHO2_12_FULL_41_17]|uniref:Uncharacterized protein n=1 Tax=Candidatus Curtissbacteria bacterium RIFCSPHIGHO2_12_FULL_41_17 TaxID=1797722 RepID=A0A1F5HL68_9BACT|nr:MAG: hypothetical protein A3F45_00650 [Candidatus Curtissbacteria bacterium RIFCSPHIGHO2_12_FULL_41_17]
MSYKVKIRWLIGGTVVSFAVSIALYYINPVFDNVGFFFELFAVISFILLMILHFLPEQIFNSWLKFARIYIPIALVLAVGDRASGSDLFNTDAEFFTTFFSVIFVIASIILIVCAHRRLKRQTKTTPFPAGDQKPV